MSLFVLSLILAVTGVVLLTVPGLLATRAMAVAAGTLALIAALCALALSTAIYVDDDKGGIVVRKFGPDLPANRVVAVNGEKGPQAKVLGPGWHFGFWPWLYDLNLVETLTLDQGQVGVLVALDGKSLPEGTVYADAWASAEEMLDGEKFLANDAKGYRGPQLTVLTPGRYRYNPRLFKIDSKPAQVVHVGEVMVIKANAGPLYTPPAGAKIEEINGSPLVPKGFRGLWNEAVLPGAYNYHPDAYQFVRVQVTKRVYTYQDDKWSIKVRSKDGFTFPVDVRVGVEVSALNAPRLVAILGDPDKVEKNEQEDETFSRIESMVVLPLIRTSFRDVAETLTALQFIDSRSKVEADATTLMRKELETYFLHTDGVFVANIELDHTEAGKALITTQTDRVVAVNQQQMYTEQKKAQIERASLVKAQEEAEQQRNVVAASFKVLVMEQQAKAREAEAQGEASYIAITAEAKQKAYTAMAVAIGAEGVTTLELFKLVSDGKIQITPHVMVTGGDAGGTLNALAGTILGHSASPAGAPAPASDAAKPRGR